MNLLMVGSGKGSWEMRGRQLGAVMGARVTSAPTEADWRWADCVVLVKRAGTQWASSAHRYGVPIVWDALDFWHQPPDNRLDQMPARRVLHQAIKAIQPARVIGATQAMADAAGGVYLPHHGRLGLRPTPARDQVQVVGYDGNERYLDTWLPALQAACTRRGWTFVVNPPDLTQVDLLVALRGGQWDGWICREWKSGVKLVNAILAGRPVITQDSAAWREIRPEGSAIATAADLETAFDDWTPWVRRARVVAQATVRAPQFTVDAIAPWYAGLMPVGASC